LALQTERDRRYAEKEAGRETALAAALLAVKEKNEAALQSLATATAVLAKTTIADKAAANEWRGTVNDIISQAGGARNLWAAIAAAIALGFLVWNGLHK
jgi:type IV secretory pathway VirB2 component (pilin)